MNPAACECVSVDPAGSLAVSAGIYLLGVNNSIFLRRVLGSWCLAILMLIQKDKVAMKYLISSCSLLFPFCFFAFLSLSLHKIGKPVSYLYLSNVAQTQGHKQPRSPTYANLTAKKWNQWIPTFRKHQTLAFQVVKVMKTQLLGNKCSIENVEASSWHRCDLAS